MKIYVNFTYEFDTRKEIIDEKELEKYKEKVQKKMQIIIDFSESYLGSLTDKIDMSVDWEQSTDNAYMYEEIDDWTDSETEEEEIRMYNKNKRS